MFWVDMNFCSMFTNNVSCLDDYHVDMMSHHVPQRRIFLMCLIVCGLLEGNDFTQFTGVENDGFAPLKSDPLGGIGGTVHTYRIH